MSATDTRIVTHPGLQPLWDSMERDRRQQQAVAIGLMLLSLFLVIFGVTTRLVGWALVGSGLATAALYWLFRILSEQPVAYWRHRLREDPESVAWVYATVTERMPFGFKTVAEGTLYLVASDGDSESFAVRPDKLKLVMKTLNRVLPNAEFGYTEEREFRHRGEVLNPRARSRYQLWEEWVKTREVL